MTTVSTSVNRKGKVTGLFMDIAKAEEVYQSLIDKGYNKNEVSLVMSNRTHMRLFSEQHRHDSERRDKVPSRMETPVGDTLVEAAAANGTALFLPAEDLVISGPIAATIVSAGVDGTPLNLIGELTGSTIASDELRQYETGLNSGGILLSVLPRNQEDAEQFEAHCQKISEETATGFSFESDSESRSTLSDESLKKSLPNERDSVSENKAMEPQQSMKQAYSDLQQGMVDTDMHGDRGVEEVVRNTVKVTIKKTRKNVVAT